MRAPVKGPERLSALDESGDEHRGRRVLEPRKVERKGRGADV
jgi:hypothetical protein